MTRSSRLRPPLRMIEAFEAAARLGSRSAAAAELNVTPGAISKQLRALEQWLGLKLFAEDGRDIMLNEAGRSLAQSVTAGMAQIGDGLAALRPQQGERSQLSVLAPATFAMKWLIPRLHRLERVAPLLQITLRQTNTHDGWLMLPHHVAIRRDGFVPTGYEAQSLLRETLTAFVAPALAAPATTPALMPAIMPALMPDQLPLLESGTRSGDLERWLIAASVQRLGQPCRRFAHFYIAYEAALAGEGLIVAPTVLASADVAAGRLLAPWPGITVPGATYSIVMPATAAMRNRAAAFLDWLYPEIEALAAPAP